MTLAAIRHSFFMRIRRRAGLPGCIPFSAIRLAGDAIIGGMRDRTMSWAEVAERLAAARTYWLGTTTVSGAPHAAPVWGAVTGGTLADGRRPRMQLPLTHRSLR